MMQLELLNQILTPKINCPLWAVDSTDRRNTSLKSLLGSRRPKLSGDSFDCKTAQHLQQYLSSRQLEFYIDNSALKRVP